jgi:hypothetical protein
MRYCLHLAQKIKAMVENQRESDIIKIKYSVKNNCGELA